MPDLAKYALVGFVCPFVAGVTIGAIIGVGVFGGYSQERHRYTPHLVLSTLLTLFLYVGSVFLIHGQNFKQEQFLWAAAAAALMGPTFGFASAVVSYDVAKNFSS